MFTLRVVNPDNTEDNYFLGSWYKWHKPDYESKSFRSCYKEIFKEDFPTSEDDDHSKNATFCAGIVQDQTGLYIIHLEQYAYICNEKGGTYETINKALHSTLKELEEEFNKDK